MTTIYLIRHAEAEGNVCRRMHGQYDGLVTRRGLLQIEKLAARFADARIDAVYSSDLYRARKTASALNRPVIMDERLREMNMGEWENVPFGEVLKFEPEQARHLDHDPRRLTVPGLEPFDAIGERFAAAMRDIAAAHDGGTAAAVSHAMVMGAFFNMNLSGGNEIAEVSRITNTAVTRLVCDGGGRFTAEYMGDASHLPPELDTSLRRREQVARLGGSAGGNLRYVQTGEYSWDALLGDTYVGAAAIDPARDADAGVITRLEILDGYRGAGLGTQLLGQAISACRAVGRTRLRVESPGGGAGFFARMWFEPTGGGAMEMALYAD